MGDVFANGLEISGKAVSAKTIAAFPDVCFTPPENPATPPGVPVPYPNFAMAGDTEKGTSTVKIKDKIVNLKNKSDMSKTSGDEAGCAAKKGVVTSKNTGKSYFNSWSNNVKFEGEPVVRMSDLTTNNHNPPPGNSPPWPHIAGIKSGELNCAKILADLELHRHGDKDCPDGHESEHFVQNEYLQHERGKVTAPQFESYKLIDAPCICMKAYNPPGSKDPKRGSPHWKKTMQCNKAIKQRTSTPTIKESVGDCCQATVDNDPRTKDKTPKEKKDVMKCLEAVFMDYLERCNKDGDSKEEIGKQPIAWEVNKSPKKMWIWE